MSTPLGVNRHHTCITCPNSVQQPLHAQKQSSDISCERGGIHYGLRFKGHPFKGQGWVVRACPSCNVTSFLVYMYVLCVCKIPVTGRGEGSCQAPPVIPPETSSKKQGHATRPQASRLRHPQGDTTGVCVTGGGRGRPGVRIDYFYTKHETINLEDPARGANRLFLY